MLDIFTVPCVPVAGEAVLTRVDGVAGAGVVLPRPQRGAGGLAAPRARKQLRREGPAEKLLSSTYLHTIIIYLHTISTYLHTVSTCPAPRAARS